MLLHLHARKELPRTQTGKPFIERGSTLLPYLPVMLSKEKWPAAAPAPEFEESDIEQAEMMRWLLAAENGPLQPLLRTHTCDSFVSCPQGSVTNAQS